MTLAFSLARDVGAILTRACGGRTSTTWGQNSNPSGQGLEARASFLPSKLVRPPPNRFKMQADDDVYHIGEFEEQEEPSDDEYAPARESAFPVLLFLRAALSRAVVPPRAQSDRIASAIAAARVSKKKRTSEPRKKASARSKKVRLLSSLRGP